MSAPASMAFSKAKRVFSGKLPEAPRWATLTKATIKLRWLAQQNSQKSWNILLECLCALEMYEELLIALWTKQRRLDHTAAMIAKLPGASRNLVNHTHMLLVRADNSSLSHVAFSHFKLRLDQGDHLGADMQKSLNLREIQ